MKSRIALTILFLMTLGAWAAENPFMILKTTPIAISVPGAHIAPRWSPDGNHFAFSAPGYKGLWIASSDGKELKQVSDEAAAGFGFYWSPQSDQISYNAAHFENMRRQNAVTVYNVQSSKTKRLTPFDSRMPLAPQWLSNNEILFGEQKKQRAIVSANALESPLRPLAYVHNQKIYIDRPSASAPLVINPFPGRDYLNLRLSPDGKKVVFELMAGNLFVMNTDGSARVDLGRGYRPAWSPDSRFVVFMRTVDDGYIFTASDLWIASVDGKMLQQLTATNEQLEMDPDWSPDGTKILYDDQSDGNIYQLTIGKR